MRSMLLIAGALMLATPAVAASPTTPGAVPAPHASAGIDRAPVEPAQFVIRERYRTNWRDRRWRDNRRWDRRWDGYTGQVCRTRTVYTTNRFGERVRRVIRTCN